MQVLPITLQHRAEGGRALAWTAMLSPISPGTAATVRVPALGELTTSSANPQPPLLLGLLIQHLPPEQPLLALALTKEHMPPKPLPSWGAVYGSASVSLLPRYLSKAISQEIRTPLQDGIWGCSTYQLTVHLF